MIRFLRDDVAARHPLSIRLTTFILALLIVSPAVSQNIVDACERVAIFEFGIQKIHTRDIQSFPELYPPRVQMRVSGEGPSEDLIADALSRALNPEQPADAALRDYGVVRCEFESAETPFRLIKFECSGFACQISDARLEELRVLLHREFAAEGDILGPVPNEEAAEPLEGSDTALAATVGQCWNMGVLSTDAMKVTVTVSFTMTNQGRHEQGSIRLVSAYGGTELATQQAFEAARRAIVRCEGDGYELLPGSDADNQEVEMTFTPIGMRAGIGVLLR